MADVVAVQQVGVVAAGEQALLDQVGDGGLARAGQAGEPQAARRLALDRGARRAVHVERLPLHVGGASQGEVQRTAGHGGKGLPVHQDEGAERRIVGIRLEGNRLVEAEVAGGDLVELQALGGDVFLGVDVGFVLDLGDARGHGACAGLEKVVAAGQQRLVAHPQQVRGELVGDRRHRVRGGQHVAAADVDLVLERDQHGLSRHDGVDSAVANLQRADA